MIKEHVSYSLHYLFISLSFSRAEASQEDKFDYSKEIYENVFSTYSSFMFGSLLEELSDLKQISSLYYEVGRILTVEQM